MLGRLVVSRLVVGRGFVMSVLVMGLFVVDRFGLGVFGMSGRRGVAFVRLRNRDFRNGDGVGAAQTDQRPKPQQRPGDQHCAIGQRRQRVAAVQRAVGAAFWGHPMIATASGHDDRLAAGGARTAGLKSGE